MSPYNYYEAIPVISNHKLYPLNRQKYRKGTLVQNSTVPEDYFDRLFIVFGGREALSKSSQSVLCIVKDGTTLYLHFQQCLRFAWCSLSRPVPPETEQRLYLHRALLFPQDVVHPGMSVIQARGSLMSKCSHLVHCFGGCTLQLKSCSCSKLRSRVLRYIMTANLGLYSHLNSYQHVQFRGQHSVDGDVTQ